jgi:hypothetical protein
MKAAAMAKEIPTAAEATKGALVPRNTSALSSIAEPLSVAQETLSPLAQVAKEGLESPGRRKVLKQMASMAAQAAVPAPVAKALKKTVAKNVLPPELAQVVTSPLDEGIARAAEEAGIAQMVPRSEVVKRYMESFLSGRAPELYHEPELPAGLIRHSLTHFYPEEHLPHLNSAMEKLSGVKGHDYIHDLGPYGKSQLMTKARQAHNRRSYREWRDEAEQELAALSTLDPEKHAMSSFELAKLANTPGDLQDWAKRQPKGEHVPVGSVPATRRFDWSEALTQGQLAKILKGKESSYWTETDLPEEYIGVLQDQLKQLNLSPQEIKSIQELQKLHSQLPNRRTDLMKGEADFLIEQEAPTSDYIQFKDWAKGIR